VASSYTVIISVLYLSSGIFIFLLGLTILRIGSSSTPTRAAALILFFAGLGPILSATGIILQNTLREGSFVFKTMVENFEYLWEFYFPSVLLFSLSFPKEKWIIRKLPLVGFLLFAPYIAHLAMMIFGDNIQNAIFSLYKGDPLKGDLPIGSGDFSLSGLNKLLSAVIKGLVKVHRGLFSLVNIVYFMLAIVILGGSLRFVINPRIAGQLRTVLIGLVVSIVAYTMTKVLSLLFGQAVPEDASLALLNLSLIAGGGTIAFAVVRQQFLGIRYVVRRSVLYSGVTIVFAALYLIVVKPVSDFFGTYSEASKEAFETGVIILAIIAFQPVLIRIEEILQNILMKGKDDTGTKFKNLGSEISNVTNVEELEGVLKKGFREILDASTVRLMLNGNLGDEEAFVGVLEEIGEPVKRPELLRIEERKKKASEKKSALLGERSERIDTGALAVLSDPETIISNMEVFVPIFRERRCVGYIGLGEKIYGVHYSNTELAHLSVLSNQIGIAVDNIRLLAENVGRKVLEEELKIARKVQLQLQPREAPPIEGYELYGIAVPSRQMAGDYYDYIFSSTGSLALTIADVSGKGIPASILTASLHAAIRSNADAQNSPVAMLDRVNSLLYSSTSPEEFATLFYGVVDLKSGLLRYANAGHEFPFLVSSEGATGLGESGIILGCMEDYPYVENTCKIPRGASLVLYTDGVTDSESSAGDSYGSERLRQVLAANVDKSAKDLCSKVLEEINHFSKEGESLDDMSLIILKRL
jgi:sigma-B regulation protein RsbU (phosphoserine phosphatase)